MATVGTLTLAVTTSLGAASRVDGQLDPTFSRDGVAAIPGFVTAQHATPGGRLLVGGEVYASGAMFVSRFTVSGNLDPTFAGDGTFDGHPGAGDAKSVDALVPYGNGVLVVGTTWIRGPFTDRRLVLLRLTGRGQVDPSFSGDGWLALDFGNLIGLDVQSAIVLADGRIALVVTTSSPTGWAHTWLLRLRPDGTLDPTLGGGGVVSLGDSVVEAVLLPSGRLYDLWVYGPHRSDFLLERRGPTARSTPPSRATGGGASHATALGEANTTTSWSARAAVPSCGGA